MSRQSTSMSLDSTVLSQARALGVNLSKAAEQARQWKAENAAGIADYNAMIAQEGIVLSDRRKF